MMITRKALSRRTVLRTLGAALPLPFLDAMVPALTALQRTAAQAPLRFGAVYVPNGVIPGQWFPSAEGRAFEFTPSLKPLERFRDQVLPRKWQRVFVARFVEQQEQSAAARSLGMRRTTLAYQEYRIRRLLRRYVLRGDRQ